MFRIGLSDGASRMPVGVIRALAQIKIAAAEANAALGKLSVEKKDLIVAAAERVVRGELDDHFPLLIWQTGSGTQTNMNVNEVIANVANVAAAGGDESALGSKKPVHPNDDVNMSQSSNDVFPAAMHVAIVDSFHSRLLPAAHELGAALAKKAREFADVVKIGRTHAMDATPLTLGHEVAAWAFQLHAAAARCASAASGLLELPLGGTAVGTGLNAPEGFAAAACQALARRTGHAYAAARNPFALMACHDGVVAASAAARGVAVTAQKIATDVRLLGSGPRAGLGELKLPENEPGSSIMPGKVNPTQCEALIMVALHVAGLDSAVAAAGASGVLELNVAKPLMVANTLAAAGLLADALGSFSAHCVADMEADRPRIAQHVAASLMLVTALNTHIGYDAAAKIARAAHTSGRTLREAALEAGVSAADFDAWVRPEDMVGHHTVDSLLPPAESGPAA